ncbi:hypothetical protein CEUSTIGMA_g12149.t1 [Chlamydomonas eustigma]|uniref:Prefoldin subunit 1 n=1 Tax=Chlamydomonas eustigma TaxID=1157962 RepID=A0A250XNS9_9CHLO|nr:hypothetical protein CEUSTIGMA_g12149.t1 [Chlamydomonas eustigma]|eukprot:GAX84727.1 hypothetical protein CEUSTIGMA_g12149.t1 [Chlamydomonas eustigma]
MSEREEREKAFIELHEKYAQTIDGLRRLTQSERANQLGKQRLELVLKELGSMPDNVPTYKQIGRAYFLEPKSELLSTGAKSIATMGSDLENFKQSKSAVEQKLKEIQKEIQEMAK